VNLFPEKNPQETTPPVPVTHYPRPGLTLLSSPPAQGFGRCLYTATNGKLFAVVGQTIFHLHYEDGWEWHNVGDMLTPANTPVCAADNGVDALFVDNSMQGYSVEIDTAKGHVFTQLGDPNFQGGTRVDYLDSFLVLNQPNSPNWYCSLSNQLLFNALFYGTKTAWPDDIQTIIAIEREVWLLGTYKSEVWYNAGGVPFPFQAQPGLIIEHGCCAPYSVAKQDINIYWLSQSPEGARMVMKGTQHSAQRISTHAIEAEFLQYPRVDDCIASTYQIVGHAFVAFHFPTADKTWVWDEATQQWHEETHIDTNGLPHRSLAAFNAYAYGFNVALDWQTGNLYKVDPTNFTDNGNPIEYIRSFPHIADQDSNRLTVWKLISDIEIGPGTGTQSVPTTTNPWSMGFSSGFGPKTLTEPPLISLRTSRTRGESWGSAVMQPMGAGGQYYTRPTWNRLGFFVDGVFELSWSTPMKTALNGAFITVEEHMADE